jgi:outer membrane protein assembly factor BamB
MLVVSNGMGAALEPGGDPAVLSSETVYGYTLDGHRAWELTFENTMPAVTDFGLAQPTPATAGGTVAIIHTGDDTTGAVVALDVRSGQERWRAFGRPYAEIAAPSIASERVMSDSER